MTMKSLIEALQIFLKYKDLGYPTYCMHDTLVVVGITQEEVSPEDQARLGELGFFWNDSDTGDEGAWASFRYG
jgi:hypothetical protein